MAPIELRVQQCRLTNGDIQVADLETVSIQQKYQVLNIGDFCNECGNCATFCPTSGSPYKDKAKFHLSQKSYDASSFGYHFASYDELLWKDGDQSASLKRTSEGLIFENHEVKAKINPVSYEAEVAEIKTDNNSWVALRPAAEMCILFQTVSRHLGLFSA